MQNFVLVFWGGQSSAAVRGSFLGPQKIMKIFADSAGLVLVHFCSIFAAFLQILLVLFLSSLHSQLDSQRQSQLHKQQALLAMMRNLEIERLVLPCWLHSAQPAAQPAADAGATSSLLDGRLDSCSSQN